MSKSRNMSPNGRRLKDHALIIPHSVLKSPAYRMLSATGVKLLIDIAGQYKGFNNGDLHCTMSLMRESGWRSPTTLHKAKRELLEAGLIERTRDGDIFRGVSLYAITWRPIDKCINAKTGNPRHDVKPTERASNLWKDSGREAA